MRKINNKRKLYSIINKTGLTTFLVGTGSIVLSTLPEDINTKGILAGLTLTTAGMCTHLIMHNIEYKNNLMDDDLLNKKSNSFYKKGLLKEQEKLQNLEFYLEDILTGKDEDEVEMIKEDLYSDQLLVEKELEILDLDLDADTDEIDEYYKYIDFLERVPRSEEYLSIKNKFLHIDKEVYKLPNVSEKKNKKTLKIINKK